MLAESVLMRREPASAHQTLPAIDEEIGHLDDPGIDPPRQRRDLAHAAPTGALRHKVDYEIYAPRDRGDHELRGDVLAREERQRAQLGHGLASAVGMQCRH